MWVEELKTTGWITNHNMCVHLCVLTRQHLETDSVVTVIFVCVRCGLFLKCCFFADCSHACKHERRFICVLILVHSLLAAGPQLCAFTCFTSACRWRSCRVCSRRVCVCCALRSTSCCFSWRNSSSSWTWEARSMSFSAVSSIPVHTPGQKHTQSFYNKQQLC